MTLEEEAWRAGGAPRTRPRARPATPGDVVMRLAALLALLAMVGLTIFAFSLVLGQWTPLVLFGVLILLVVHLVFRVRQLASDLAATQRHIEDLERAQDEPSAPTAPTGEEAGP